MDAEGSYSETLWVEPLQREVEYKSGYPP